MKGDSLYRWSRGLGIALGVLHSLAAGSMAWLLVLMLHPGMFHEAGGWPTVIAFSIGLAALVTTAIACFAPSLAGVRFSATIINVFIVICLVCILFPYGISTGGVSLGALFPVVALLFAPVAFLGVQVMRWRAMVVQRRAEVERDAELAEWRE
jgi:hypothetical protein